MLLAGIVSEVFSLQSVSIEVAHYTAMHCKGSDVEYSRC